MVNYITIISNTLINSNSNDSNIVNQETKGNSSIKECISKLLKMIAMLISTSNEENLRRFYYCELNNTVYQILNLATNDPYILIGCVNFVKEILNNDFFDTDKIHYSKICESVTSFQLSLSQW